jgi:hypothetical protein
MKHLVLSGFVWTLILTIALTTFANTPETVDEFGAIAFRDEQVRLDRLAVLLEKYPSHYAYILRWYTNGTSLKRIHDRQSQVIKYLTEIKHIPTKRVVFVNKFEQKERTVYYLVPPNPKSLVRNQN